MAMPWLASLSIHPPPTLIDLILTAFSPIMHCYYLISLHEPQHHVTLFHPHCANCFSFTLVDLYCFDTHALHLTPSLPLTHAYSLKSVHHTPHDDKAWVDYPPRPLKRSHAIKGGGRNGLQLGWCPHIGHHRGAQCSWANA